MMSIMNLKRTALLILFYCILPTMVIAAEDASSAVAGCAALRNPDAYGEKYRSYVHLVAGKDEWVFRSNKDFKQKFKFDDRNARLYRDFARALKTRGTTLVLSVIPTRGIVAHEKLLFDDELTKNYDPIAAKASYDTMIARLNRHGVLTVGTSAPKIGADYFNRADQHWSPKGAQEMAQDIAALIKKPDLWNDVPEKGYETTIGKEIRFDARYSEIVEKLCGFDLPQEKYNEPTTALAEGEEKGEAKIVLVGTSNSKRDEFGSNFGGFLREALSADVYNAAISGGGMDDSILNYLDSKSYQDNPPAFLIWEVPVYYNLGGEGMEDTLRQGIGRVYGYCVDPLVEFAAQKADGKKLYLMKDIDDRKIRVSSAYLAIEFSKAVNKNFSVFFKNTDNLTYDFKFQKRREGSSNMFFYLPEGKERAFLKHIALKKSKNIKGLTVKARLCPMPKAVH